MNTGKVIDLNEKTAIVVTDDFAFLNVKRQSDMMIGNKVKFSESDIVKPKRMMPLYASVAACFAILLSLTVLFMQSNTGESDIYAFVDIDINPSFELSIDYNDQIIDVKALNHDAQIALGDLELRGKAIKEAMPDIILKCKEQGFIAPGKENIVLISAASNPEAKVKAANENLEANVDKLLADMDKTLHDLNDSSIKAKLIKISPEERKMSMENSISMGRYAVYLKAKEQKVDLTIEAVKEADLTEILHTVSIDGEEKGVGTPAPSVEQTPAITPAASVLQGSTPPVSAPVVSSAPAVFVTPLPTPLSPGPVTSPTPMATATVYKESSTPRTSPSPSPKNTVTPALTWRDMSNIKIDQIRKREVQIKVLDSNNNSIEGVTVEVRQKSHAFAFGTALSRNGLNIPNYTKYVKDHFNWAVFENESKWYSNESSMGNVTYNDADYMYEFCRRNGIKVRGHCVFWEAEGWQPGWVTGLDPVSLRKAVDNRINSVVNHFKGRFLHWDVNNEMLHGDFFKSRLGESIWPYMFNRTTEIDPNAKIFVNNNVTTIEGAEDYIAQINWLKSQGVRIDGIGVHGHFGETVDRAALKAVLDKLSTLNIPIWITEYDSITSNEYKRADNLENLYRTAFGHPSVQGIIMWGFWEGVHWRGRDAAIVNNDWTLNEAGKRFETLMEEWTTKATGYTDSAGSFGFRGFYGTYEVTMTVPGKGKIVRTFTLNPGKGASQFTFSID